MNNSSSPSQFGTVTRQRNLGSLVRFFEAGSAPATESRAKKEDGLASVLAPHSTAGGEHHATAEQVRSAAARVADTPPSSDESDLRQGHPDADTPSAAETFLEPIDGDSGGEEAPATESEASFDGSEDSGTPRRVNASVAQTVATTTTTTTTSSSGAHAAAEAEAATALLNEEMMLDAIACYAVPSAEVLQRNRERAEAELAAAAEAAAVKRSISLFERLDQAQKAQRAEDHAARSSREDMRSFGVNANASGTRGRLHTLEPSFARPIQPNTTRAAPAQPVGQVAATDQRSSPAKPLTGEDVESAHLLDELALLERSTDFGAVLDSVDLVTLASAEPLTAQPSVCAAADDVSLSSSNDDSDVVDTDDDDEENEAADVGKSAALTVEQVAREFSDSEDADSMPEEFDSATCPSDQSSDSDRSRTDSLDRQEVLLSITPMQSDRPRPLLSEEVLQQLVDKLKSHDGWMIEHGLFRIAGRRRSVNDLYDSIIKGSLDFGDAGPVEIASVIKRYLRECENPLIPFELYAPLIHAQQISRPSSRIKAVKTIIEESLPEANKRLLAIIIPFIRMVAGSPGIGMDLDGVCKLLSPALARPPKERLLMDPNALKSEMQLSSIVITYYEYLFGDREFNLDRLDEKWSQKLIMARQQSLQINTMELLTGKKHNILISVGEPMKSGRFGKGITSYPVCYGDREVDRRFADFVSLRVFVELNYKDIKYPGEFPPKSATKMDRWQGLQKWMSWLVKRERLFLDPLFLNRWEEFFTERRKRGSGTEKDGTGEGQSSPTPSALDSAATTSSAHGRRLRERTQAKPRPISEKVTGTPRITTTDAKEKEKESGHRRSGSGERANNRLRVGRSRQRHAKAHSDAASSVKDKDGKDKEAGGSSLGKGRRRLRPASFLI